MRLVPPPADPHLRRLSLSGDTLHHVMRWHLPTAASLRLFPRGLFCSPRDGCCALAPVSRALCAWSASASGSLRSQICTLSLSLRGHLMFWRRLSQLVHVARCHASIACAKGHARCRGKEIEGLWYETCWRHLLETIDEKGLRVRLRAGPRSQPGSRRASASRIAALSWKGDGKRSGALSVVERAEGDARCNCEHS
jgi:hypothetical protein